MLTLNNLKPNYKAKVKSLLSKDNIRRRLQDIGLVDNTEVMCLFDSPYGGTKAYLIRGAVIALREEDASSILIDCL